MKPVSKFFSKIKLYVIGLCFVHLDLLDFCCFFVIIYRTAPEEQLEEDHNYTEELGDDQPAGAMSHTTS